MVTQDSPLLTYGTYLVIFYFSLTILYIDNLLFILGTQYPIHVIYTQFNMAINDLLQIIPRLFAENLCIFISCKDIVADSNLIQ